MKRNKLLTATMLLCCFAAPRAYCGENELRGTASGVVSSRQLSKIKPGLTKVQVRSLLGNPWRTVQYNDLDEIENEMWEYRGHDAGGPYRLHIEFDAHNVVRIVGKIPDQTRSGAGTSAM